MIALLPPPLNEKYSDRIHESKIRLLKFPPNETALEAMGKAETMHIARHPLSR